ncbi:hypothetical protein BSKO_04878 [Bryopsis sp. KO-2023]|nr:hypothetical protein BSKO_04878 [Bryopsis sp. KO-2023]
MTTSAAFSAGRLVASGRFIRNHWASCRNPHARVSRLFSSQGDLPQPRSVDELLQLHPPEPFSQPQSSQERAEFAALNQRYKADLAIFKRSGAINMNLIMPTWKTVTGGTRVRSRQGGLLIEFARGTGERTYDWENKKTFAMSPVELATLLDEPTKPHEFIHDPNINASSRGSIIKVFQCTMAERGLFFKLRVKERDSTEEWSISIPVSNGEYKLFQIISAYTLPYLMGFDQVVNQK